MYVLMTKLGMSLNEIRQLDPSRLVFLVEMLNRAAQEEKAASRKAKRKGRRR